MCLNFFKIRKSPHQKIQNAGKLCVFAPCGYCEECLNMNRYAWAWRLTSDLQYYVKERGYAAAFVTLTYNDSHLPRFPKSLDLLQDFIEYCRKHKRVSNERKREVYREMSNSYSRTESLSGLPCFSKEDTQNLILYIRKVAFRKYRLKEILYFLASEFGPSTQRPHYHMILSWDKSKCTVAQMHSLIRHYWVEYANKGFITPDKLMGGVSRKTGKRILPFEIGCLNDVLNSSFYTAKYVTKDSLFMSQLRERISKNDLKYLKQWLPHHIQTLGLGYKGIASLSDAEKIDLLKNGRSFLGENHLMKPPSYIQNKLVFTPHFIVDEKGKKLVKRELTDFFKRNFEQIIGDKLTYYETLFEKMSAAQYWLTRGLSSDCAFSAAELVSSFRLKSCSLPEAYVFYYGVNYNYCFENKKLCFFNRYRYPSLTYSALPKIPLSDWVEIKRFFGLLLSYCRWEIKDVPQLEPDHLRDDFNKVSYEDINYYAV